MVSIVEICTVTQVFLLLFSIESRNLTLPQVNFFLRTPSGQNNFSILFLFT